MNQKDKPFFTVDYSKTNQLNKNKEQQQNCIHLQTDMEISLVDGNFPTRKSTLLSGYCLDCGTTETLEL